eukprot:CAMPEP_0194188442 /NCGR_PEP_ID=MMETSP0154-20130528/55060_1 /TAXON_ID=1049557 /ORGANISM="Thalassiothrix antarctica, Strain L6-D1" /LENGTH=93 /DNA_ID=CAMNT_0038908877 /DNA_START=27 /DNA_END=304 /DNA_ORIENTATION=-
MQTTYGYKSSKVRGNSPTPSSGTTGAYNDQYPLSHLVRLLCCEDMDEARRVCRHYNITVLKKTLTSSSSKGPKTTPIKSREYVFWKASKFSIP